MIEFDQYRLQLLGMQDNLATLKEALHIGNISDELSELEARAQEPGFWDDVEKAQQIQTRMRRLQMRIERFSNLERQKEDLLVLCELGDEEDDAEILQEVTEGVAAFLEKRKPEFK